MWLIFLGLYFVTATCFYLFRRTLAKSLQQHRLLIHSVSFSFFMLPVGVCLGLIFPHNFDIGIVNMLLLIFGSIIWPLDWLMAFRANQKVDVGVFTVISNLAPLFTLSIALTLLNEKISMIQAIAILLLLISGLVVSLPLIRKKHVHSKEIMIAVLSAAILGIGIVYERFMLNRVDFGTYLILGWGSQTVWALILAHKQLREIPALTTNKKLANQIVIFAGLMTLQSVSFISALKLSGRASIMGPASNFLTVVVVIAAYFILKEKDHLLAKVAASIIGVVGLILIAS